MKVGYVLVPFLGLRTAQVRPQHEARVDPHFDLGLEGVGPVGPVVVRRTSVLERQFHLLLDVGALWPFCVSGASGLPRLGAEERSEEVRERFGV